MLASSPQSCCLLTFVLFLGLSLPLARAQQIVFQKAYSLGLKAHAEAVIATSDGGYMAAGYVWPDSITPTDYVLVKTDGNGDTLWTKIFEEPGAQGIIAIVQLPDGSYLAGGANKYMGLSAQYAEVLRFDPQGEILWRQRYGPEFSDHVNDLEILPDGHAVWAGRENEQMTMKKIDLTGSIVWEKTYFSNLLLEAYDVEPVQDGGFILAGVRQLPQAGIVVDLCVMRTDSAGNLLWEELYGYNQYDSALEINETPEGDFIIAGYHEQPINTQAAILKIDSVGNRLVDLSIGYGYDDYFCDVEIMPDNQYVFTGSIQTPTTNIWDFDSDGFFVGANADCDTLWSLSVNDQDFQFYFDACQSADGGIVACGTRRPYYSLTSWSDTVQFFLIKINGWPVSTAELTAGPLVSVEPNPASDAIRFQLPWSAADGDVFTVFDAAGRRVRSHALVAGSDQYSTDVSLLPPGLYVATFQVATYPPASIRFIVTR